MGCHDRTELWVSSGVQGQNATHYTKYKRSVRLGWDQPDMSVRSMGWPGHGVLENEREVYSERGHEMRQLLKAKGRRRRRVTRYSARDVVAYLVKPWGG